MKGCVISAATTGAGKTTVMLGLLAALRNSGIAVQPFKVGPDFIDPGLHEIACGVDSHNLDGWMLLRETNEWLFKSAAEGKDVALVEGVMGLFDGFDGTSERGSTAEMAKWLDLPVILVIDAHPMARSAAALLHGFRTFDPDLKVAGIIFNRVAGEGHFRILADAIKDTPIIGWLPANEALQIPERHLGLLTGAEEVAALRIRALADFFARHVDIGALLSLLEQHQPVLSARGLAPIPSSAQAGSKRVAMAQDKAFSFYYRANRMALEQAGGQIVEFSPLADPRVPEADLLYIGGGYPELYRKELEANTSMRRSIRRFIDSGKNFYAECGGLMYLSESINAAPMVGAIPTKIEMTDRLVDFGYCEVTTRGPSILGPAGTVARGHQFHYSRSINAGGGAYDVLQGVRRYSEGFVFPNGIASYIHLHFLSNPGLARNMLNSYAL